MNAKKHHSDGLLLAIAAYSTWGFFPLYFSYLSIVSPIEVLAQRIIWSLVTTLIIAIILKRWTTLIKALHNKTLLGWLALSALLISLNWLVYIWAVGQNRVLEASLGYFISPVLSLILAKLFFAEELHPLQAWAGIIATLAIVWELFSLGQLPWISLVLALAFALYGVIRKHSPIDGISGMTIETIVLLPFALVWIGWQSLNPLSSLIFSHDYNLTLLLIGAGVLSAFPLILFAMATRRIDLSIVGFIMYINPTMQFLIAVFILDESVSSQKMVTFTLVWSALIIFMIGLVRSSAKSVPSYND